MICEPTPEQQAAMDEVYAQIAAGDQVVRDALDPAAQHRAGDQRSQKVNGDDGNDHRGRIRGVHESANWILALHGSAPAERR